MDKSFLGWFEDNPTLGAVLGGVGVAVCGAGFQQTWGTWRALAWLIGIALFIALPTVGARRNRLLQGRRAGNRAIRKLLAACAAAYGAPGRHVRTNVMLVTEDGKRRRVQAETAYNMDRDGDYDLELDVTAGVSGEAFVRRISAYGDLGLALNPGGPTWGLRPSEQAKVRQTLKSILSVPILDPDNPNGAPLGTLQVDSDLTIEEIGFDDPKNREVAERFADVVALLLQTQR